MAKRLLARFRTPFEFLSMETRTNIRNALIREAVSRPETLEACNRLCAKMGLEEIDPASLEHLDDELRR